MTLCIAAECFAPKVDEPAIVMCADWRAQTGTESGALIGTDDAYKIKKVADQMYALIAGDPSAAGELITDCKQAVRNFTAASEHANEDDTDLIISKFQTELRQAATKRKQEIIRTFVTNRYGMTFEQLYHTPKHEYTDFHENLWLEIRQLTLGADVVFCGFCDETPAIIRLDRFGNAPWVSNYCTVGTGAEVARALLCLQPWAREKTGPVNPVGLAQCLYRVFEAKQAAHIADPQSVGEDTALQILIARAGAFGVTKEFFDQLRDLFDKKNSVPSIEASVLDIVGDALPIRWRKE